MEIALAPFGIAGHGRWLVSRRQRLRVSRIDVLHIEDDAAPPGPALLLALRDQVEIARPGTKVGERRGLAAVQDLEAERSVEPNGAPHVVGGKRNGTDRLNHDDDSADLKAF